MKRSLFFLPVIVFLFALSCKKDDTTPVTGSQSNTTSKSETYSSKPGLNKFIGAGNTFDTISTHISLNVTGMDLSNTKFTIGDMENVDVTKLKISLIHNGIEVFLIDSLSKSGTGFINTHFDDSAAISISSGTSPYTGTFKPHHPLSGFNGGNASGDWIIKIYNSGNAKTGVIKSWSITITYSLQNGPLTINENYLVTTGDLRKYKYCDTNGISPGTGGENVTWDFTNLNILAGETTEEWIEPYSLQMYSHFPESNIASFKLGDTSYHYSFYNVNKSKEPFFQSYGDADSSSGLNLTEYLPSVKLAKGSISYGTIYIDSGRVHIVKQKSGITIWGGYKDTISNDGWGTLKLPGNITYNNVLRQKSSFAEADTINGSIPSQSLLQVYSWYVNGNKFPALRIQIHKVTGATGSYITKEVVYTTQNVSTNKK